MKRYHLAFALLVIPTFVFAINLSSLTNTNTSHELPTGANSYTGTYASMAAVTNQWCGDHYYATDIGQEFIYQCSTPVPNGTPAYGSGNWVPIVIAAPYTLTPTLSNTMTFTPTPTGTYYTSTPTNTFSKTPTPVGTYYTATNTATKTPTPLYPPPPVLTSTPTLTPTVSGGCTIAGYSTVASANAWNLAGEMFASPCTVVNGGILDSIELYLSSNTTPTLIQAGIYQTQQGPNAGPSQLLVESTPQTSVLGWNYLKTVPYVLKPGVYYTSAESSNTGSSVYSEYDTGVGTAIFYYYSDTWATRGSLPQNFIGYSSAVTIAGYIMSIYLNVCPAGIATPVYSPTPTLTCNPASTPICGNQATPTITFTPWPFPISPAGAVPPMGWCDGNLFANSGGASFETEAFAKQESASMTAKGLTGAGYIYQNFDDGDLASARDSSGGVSMDVSRFPDGPVSMGQYFHANGFKWGMYSTSNTVDCIAYQPGSYGHEGQDAATFISWGIDELKYDDCGSPDPYSSGLTMMQYLSQATTPKILYLSNYYSFPWQPQFSNMWRISDDLEEYFSGHSRSFDVQFPRALALYQQQGPYGWNDIGENYVGTGSMSVTEDQAEFYGMCELGEQLMMLFNPITVTNATVTLITNPEAIAVDQDPLALAGRAVTTIVNGGGNEYVVSKPIIGNNRNAVLLINFDSGSHTMGVTFSQCFGADGNNLPGGSYLVRDIATRSDVGWFPSSYSVTVPSHAATFLTISPIF